VANQDSRGINNNGMILNTNQFPDIALAIDAAAIPVCVGESPPILINDFRSWRAFDASRKRIIKGRSAERFMSDTTQTARIIVNLL
jgi:hypothetical protein